MPLVPCDMLRFGQRGRRGSTEHIGRKLAPVREQSQPDGQALHRGIGVDTQARKYSHAEVHVMQVAILFAGNDKQRFHL